MTKESLAKISNKFFNDPDWAIVEEMISEYIEPLKDISTVDIKKSNDEIATEVRGRQITINQLNKFLLDSRIVGQNINNKPTTFK